MHGKSKVILEAMPLSFNAWLKRGFFCPAAGPVCDLMI